MKQKHCVYCMDLLPFTADCKMFKNRAPHVVMDPGLEQWILIVDTGVIDHAEYRINYCPMCGRRLKGGD